MEVMAQGNRHIVDSDSKVDNLSLIHISEPTRP